jgi:hypothetical protein
MEETTAVLLEKKVSRLLSLTDELSLIPSFTVKRIDEERTQIFN